MSYEAFSFLKRNKLFAVLLAAELAVLCTLIAGLFGAPYKLTLTPDLFENRFPILLPRMRTA